MIVGVLLLLSTSRVVILVGKWLWIYLLSVVVVFSHYVYLCRTAMWIEHLDTVNSSSEDEVNPITLERWE